MHIRCSNMKHEEESEASDSKKQTFASDLLKLDQSIQGELISFSYIPKKEQDKFWWKKI